MHKLNLTSPAKFCETLGMCPTPAQAKLLAELGHIPRKVDVRADPEALNMRVVALFTLWRLLSVQGSHGVILAPDDEAAQPFLNFIIAVAGSTHPHLAEITGFPHWGTIHFGGKLDWHLKVLRRNAAAVQLHAEDALVSIVLDAKNRDLVFEECSVALEQASTLPGNTLFRLW